MVPPTHDKGCKTPAGFCHKVCGRAESPPCPAQLLSAFIHSFTSVIFPPPQVASKGPTLFCSPLFGPHEQPCEVGRLRGREWPQGPQWDLAGPGQPLSTPDHPCPARSALASGAQC